MTIMKKLNMIDVGMDVVKREDFLHCWWACQPVKTLWKTVQRFLKKLKVYLQFDPAIPLLGIFPEEISDYM